MLKAIIDLYVGNMTFSPFDLTEKRKEWAQFLKTIRLFFDAKGYTEISTPSVVKAGAFESTIDTLKVTYSGGSAELHSSPEIEMKKVLADFSQPIYQICKCFRDDPATPIHAVEFTMLEFYRPNCPSSQLENEILELTSSLSANSITIQQYSVYTLIKQLTGIDMELFLDPKSFSAEVKSKTNIHLSPDDSWSDIFFKIMLDIVEPSLDKDTLYLINDFPSRVSPLSKPIANSSKAERFEIYWKGMEICNGCSELTDENLLKNRYLQESEERKKAGKSPHPMPNDLYKSSKRIQGASGVAVGLERLFLAIQGNDKSK